MLTANDAGDDALDSDADPITGLTSVIDVSDPSLLTDTDGDGIVDDYSWDAGIVQSPLVEIGNYVWNDLNNDGIQDDDEPPLAGVVVELLDENGDPVLDENGDPVTAVTDAEGEYIFEVAPGNYQLQFVQPEGFVASPSNSTADDATDSDGDSSGLIAAISVAAGVDDFTLDMGFAPTQDLSGVIWDDIDGDGQLDADETVRAGVLIQLFNADSTPVTDANGQPVFATTDADGSYSFEVPPGDYRMKLTAPDGSSLSAGGGVDADGFTDVITMVNGVDITNADFGLVLTEAANTDGTIPVLAFTGLSSNYLLLMALVLLVTGSGTIATVRGGARRRQI